jgi:hypothetical protein
MLRFGSYVLLLALIYLSFSCIHDPVYIIPDEAVGEVPGTTPEPPPVIPGSDDSCDPDSVYFQNQILPIFVGSCAVTGCHDQSSREADIALISYANIMRGIRPGDPGDSKYFKVMTLEETDDLMPLDPVTDEGFRLPADQLALIEDWINQGATDNFCESCDTSNYTFGARIEPLFATNCTTSIGCHSSGSSNGSFASYAELKPFIDNGSIMDRVVVKQDMPVVAPLQACDMEVLIKWIDDGAPNN